MKITLEIEVTHEGGTRCPREAVEKALVTNATVALDTTFVRHDGSLPGTYGLRRVRVLEQPVKAAV